jgi:hypothetical protein
MTLYQLHGAIGAPASFQLVTDRPVTERNGSATTATYPSSVSLGMATASQI